MAKQVTNENPQKKPQPLSKRVMYLTTSAILIGNISFGCCTSALPPALDNIAWRYRTTIADISIVFTLLTMMYCIGAILCGLISKHVNRQAIVILSLFIMASSMLITPYCPTKILFFIATVMLGISCGFYCSSEMVWMIEIWQAKAGPFIQAQHFFYSVGTIIPSIVLAPFLEKNDLSQAKNSTESARTEPPAIHTPFLIIGSLNSLAFLYQLFLFVFYRYHTPPMYDNENLQQVGNAGNDPLDAEADLSEKVPLKQQEQNNDIAKQEVKHSNTAKCGISTRKIQLIAFGMLFVGAYQAMELSTIQFLPIFGQYSDLKLTESDAARVLTGLTLMFAAGRLLGIIIIFKVRPELIIAGNLVLIAIGNTILWMWASGSVTMFWIGSMILGAGFSTMTPSLFAFIEKHLIISGMFASGTMVLGTTTSAMYPIILGKIIEHQAVVLTYTNFASTLVCIVVMIWGYTLTRKTVTRE